ncbi:tyrosine-type recombinase/integrase [Agrobacterium vaccinii]|uniref:tyrosine-type recombinase/integrase n=1 Tax=Agrobacterium vaccinii TaxID=2735528 RepID=UPI001E3D92C5|nr:site-specific integrase [Agrobacterium vaccinii]UHS56814.1 site-specific integrase [Agrobacterium vaccinii]
MPLKLYKRKDSPSWWISGTVRGISVRKSTKTTDKKVADTVRIVLEQQLLEESIFGRRHTVTFDQAAETYLASGGSDRFLRVVRDALGKIELRNINQAALDEAARKIYPTAAAATVNRQLYTPFIAVWNYAAQNDWATVRKWRRPSERRSTSSGPRKRRIGSAPVTYEHAAEFVAGFPPAPAMVLTALFYTGMRPIELLSLCAKDVDVQGRWIVLRSSKTGEPRGVPVHEILVPLFTSLLERGDQAPQVFRTFRGKPYRVSGNYGGQLSSSIDAARRETGVRDISAYTARHSVSTQLVINGVHAHIKDQILGHAVDSMSRRYTSVPQAPLIEAINTLPVPDAWRGLWWWCDPLKASQVQSIRGRRT